MLVSVGLRRWLPTSFWKFQPGFALVLPVGIWGIGRILHLPLLRESAIKPLRQRLGLHWPSFLQRELLVARVAGSKTLLGFAGANAIGALAPLAVVLVFTRWVSPADYGKYTLWLGVVTVVASLVGQWLRQATLRYEPALTDVAELGQFRRWVNLLILGLASALVSISMLWAVWNWRGNAVLSCLIFTGACAVCMALLQQVQLARWQAAGRSGWYFGSRLVFFCGTFATGISLIFLWDKSSLALAMGQATGIGLAALFGLLDRRSVARIQIPKSLRPLPLDLLRKIRDFGAPFIPFFFANLLLVWLDRGLLAVMAGDRAVGLYSAQYALISGLISLSCMPIVLSTHRDIVKVYGADGDREAAGLVFESAVKLFFKVLGLTGMILWAGGLDLVAKMLDREYGVSPVLVWLLFPGLALGVFSNLAHKGAELAERPLLMAAAAWQATGLNFLLNLILIPMFEAEGAALATAVAYLFYVSKMLIHTRNVLQLDSPLWRVAAPTLRAMVPCLLIVGALDALPIRSESLLGVLTFGLGVGTYCLLAFWSSSPSGGYS